VQPQSLPREAVKEDPGWMPQLAPPQRAPAQTPQAPCQLDGPIAPGHATSCSPILLQAPSFAAGRLRC